MKRSVPLLAPILLLACAACNSTNTPEATNAANAAAATAAEPIPPSSFWLRANDGLTVRATIYRADKPKAIILLFHQAGSSKDEYATIAPRLVKLGYSALAIDQRSGGGLFGKNETIAVARQPASAGRPEGLEYLNAKPDLQAAVDWARREGPPIILWGSSYSASLVFPVAAENPGQVKAVLAFSPGEYFADKQFVENAAKKVTVPVFVTSAADPEEIKAAKAIADAVPGDTTTVYAPKDGVHGSSTLIAARDPIGAEANWRAVLAFLAKVAP
jgi:dienelactone hydrolase